MAKKETGIGAKRKEFLAYGMLVAALGCIWLAAEMGILKTTVPIGPVIIIVIGLSMLLPWIKK
jgi:hypothetical protein